jgi:hypothetical protein
MVHITQAPGSRSPRFCEHLNALDALKVPTSLSGGEPAAAKFRQLTSEPAAGTRTSELPGLSKRLAHPAQAHAQSGPAGWRRLVFLAFYPPRDLGSG